MPDHRARRPAQLATAGVLALAASGLVSCGTGDDALGPSTPVDLPDIRGPGDLADAYSGVLDGRMREDLDAYTGIEVTLLARVDDVIGPRAFTVTAPEGAEVEPVLVVTTPDAGDPPGEGDLLLLASTPVDDFDAEVVVDELGLSAEPGELAGWDDEVFLVTTVVEPASEFEAADPSGP